MTEQLRKDIDDCMNNIARMREKYNAAWPEEAQRLAKMLATLSEEDMARLKHEEEYFFKEYWEEDEYCLTCDALILESDKPHCYLDGRDENARYRCPECCKWLDPIDRAKIGNQ